MNNGRCARVWQAEAALDRRLSAADRAAFERHAQSCQECGRERAQLARLHDLAGSMSAPEAAPLARKRERNELLRRAHAASISSTPASLRLAMPRSAWLALPGVAVVLVLALWLGLGGGGSARAPKFETIAAPSTLWQSLGEGPAARLSLNDGSLQIAVQKLETGQSFVITLPDGELEVRGTRFVVDVKSPRTERVAVSEGLVSLRIRGQHELLLRAGDTWTAPSVASPVVAASAPVVAPPTLSAAPAPKSAPLSPKPPAVLPSAAPSLTNQFGEAMSAYAGGDFATAERLFQRFERANPHSSQVEDSLFLRAMARQRRGDGAGARQLAAEYLRRYPAGFRAAEAGRLLAAP